MAFKKCIGKSYYVKPGKIIPRAKGLKEQNINDIITWTYRCLSRRENSQKKMLLGNILGVSINNYFPSHLEHSNFTLTVMICENKK